MIAKSAKLLKQRPVVIDQMCVFRVEPFPPVFGGFVFACLSFVFL